MTDEIPVVRFKDFTLSPEPITFKIDPDIFQCVPEIPLDGLAELANLATKSGDDRVAQMNKMHDFFDGVMTFESGAIFRKRCKVSTEEEPNPNPIGMRHVKDIIPWLMEVYGLRPTQASSSSSDGSDDEDTSLTDGALVTESI